MAAVHVDTTFILDLTRARQGAEATLAACRNLTAGDWNLLAVWSDAEGATAAESLARLDGRVTSWAVGSGAGVCDWRAAVSRADGRHVVFLRPGDCVRPVAQALWRAGLARRDQAMWVVGAAPGAPYNGWWFQRDLADSAAALLLTGAAFPECTALVRRDAWLEVAARFPETTVDASRASAWLALALLQRPALLPEVVSDTAGDVSEVDAATLARLLESAARRDPVGVARLMADVSRLAAGMRIAQDGLLDVLRATDRCLGQDASLTPGPDEAIRFRRFFFALLGRGARPVSIWGAGRLGLDALRWLREHAIAVDGFLDQDPRRAGTEWGGLPVRCGACVLRSEPPTPSPLIVIASMYHPQIAADLVAHGWREGQEFGVFQRGNLSAAPGAPAA